MQMATLWEDEEMLFLTFGVTLLAGVHEASGFGSALRERPSCGGAAGRLWSRAHETVENTRRMNIRPPQGSERIFAHQGTRSCRQFTS